MQRLYSLAFKSGFRQSLVILAFAVFSASTVMGEQGDSDPEGPKIKHVPTTAVARGVPVKLVATITPEPGSVLTSQVVLVRLTDAGTPTEHAMQATSEKDVFSLVLPVSMIKGVNVFWYAIDARDDQGRIGGTIWYRVVIADPVRMGAGVYEKGGAAAAAAGAGGGAGGGGIGTAGLVVGGLLLGGGAAVIIADNDDDDDDPPKVLPPEETGGRNDDDDNGGSSTPPSCTGVTGSETVSYENLSLCGSFDRGVIAQDNIMILVCYTCPNATIEAVGTWDESDQISGFSNPSCSPTVPILLLPKPDGFPTPGSETITVYANGIQIDQIVWPPLSDFDCF